MRTPAVPAILIALLSLPAAAADGSATAGKAEAQRWCTACHVVDGTTTGTDSAPPFPTIANNPANTVDGLRAFLADPHGRMPKIDIPRQVIDDIIAYLQTLKK